MTKKDTFVPVLEHARIFSSCTAGDLPVVNNQLYAIYAKLRACERIVYAGSLCLPHLR